MECNFNPDSPTVGHEGLTAKRKAGQCYSSAEESIPLCLCDMTLSRGSCTERGDYPTTVQNSPGDQMDIDHVCGLNYTLFIACAVSDTPSHRKLSDTPPHGSAGKTQTVKWLLQEDGLYIPVRQEKPVKPFVSSMIHLSDDKSVERRPGVAQTWGIIAALIKQQEQLNVSQEEEENFDTGVFILSNLPLDIIIGRNTINKQQFSRTTPSHFDDYTNLIESQVTKESFGADTSHVRDNPHETYSTTPHDQVQLARLYPVKAHLYTWNVTLILIVLLSVMRD
jgi:hypothetical protein